MPLSKASSRSSATTVIRDNCLLGDRELPAKSSLGRIEDRPVASLKPNTLNATVFLESLADDSILELAKDIQRHGLRNPIEIAQDGTIVEGERRWRAVGTLDWEMVKTMVVMETADPETVAEYVLDAFSSTRRTSLRERVNVYRLASDVLSRRYGRPQGRPSEKDPRAVDLFWDPEQIRQAAATKAGFGSYESARKACRVVEHSDNELLTEIEGGRLSISKAYDQLRHAADPEPDEPTDFHPDTGKAQEPEAKVSPKPVPKPNPVPKLNPVPATKPTPPPAAAPDPDPERSVQDPGGENDVVEDPVAEPILVDGPDTPTMDDVTEAIETLLGACADDNERVETLDQIGEWISAQRGLLADAMDEQEAEQVEDNEDQPEDEDDILGQLEDLL